MSTRFPSFSPQRKWKIGLSVVLACIALLAIVVELNYLSARNFKQLHWTQKTQHQLSPLTVQLLNSLTSSVQIVVFFDRREPLYGAVVELIHQYAAVSSQIRPEYIDYILYPGRAQAAQAQYKLPAEDFANRIVFHAEGKTQVVYASQLSDYDYSAILTGGEATRTAFKGEQLFTSAIYSVIDPKQPVAYFLRGHGEYDPQSQDSQIGLSKFARLLEENNIAVAQLPPVLQDDIPPEDLLVIAAPQSPLLASELERISKFLNQGGRLLVLFNFTALNVKTGLEKFLADWGVDVGHTWVMDHQQSKATEKEQVVVSSYFGRHPITTPLLRSRLYLVLPRAVAARTNMPQTADAPKATELVTTSSHGVAVGNIQNNVGKTERTGQIPLIVAVEKGNIQGISADRGATRMIVAGESYFLANTFIDFEANRSFANLAVNWLLSRDLLVAGIGPRPIKEYQIILTDAQMDQIRWLLLGIMPGGIMLLGWIVWLKRRS